MGQRDHAASEQAGPPRVPVSESEGTEPAREEVWERTASKSGGGGRGTRRKKERWEQAEEQVNIIHFYLQH